MKFVIAIALIGVLAALASAGAFMLRKPRDTAHSDKRMARALALRVALSVALFLFILLSWKMGWITPHALPIGR
jgi:presenilin-like A22 family membrane protease